ncbi:MAG: hypothetical protein ABSE22_00025 [Xanthobacteraceae bacterium]
MTDATATATEMRTAAAGMPTTTAASMSAAACGVPAATAAGMPTATTAAFGRIGRG